MIKNGSHSPIKVYIERGKQIESCHYVDALVVRSSGEVVKSWGAVDEPIFPRSAIKLLQAISFIDSKAHLKYELNQKQIAMACSSHLGDELHVEQVRDWLNKMQLTEDHLVCGAHAPYDREAAIRGYKLGTKFTRSHNNCSGKHSALLATCLMLGYEPSDYFNYDHPIQVRLRNFLSEICKIDMSNQAWGVDGCGIPTYQMTVKSMAQGMANLLADDFKWKSESQVLLKAIQQEPHFLSGNESMNTDLIQESKGRIIIKSGAEGVCCVLDTEQKLGVALKAHDGALRAVESAALEVLKSISSIKSHEQQTYKKWGNTTIKNWASQDVGQIRVDLG